MGWVCVCAYKDTTAVCLCEAAYRDTVLCCVRSWNGERLSCSHKQGTVLWLRLNFLQASHCGVSFESAYVVFKVVEGC